IPSSQLTTSATSLIELIMLFVRCIFLVAGAFMASVREPSQSDPGGLGSLARQGFHRTSTALGSGAPSASPAF
ncbi:hypothetical protein FRC11_002007, partial [Ceratobasidium sp. 423]